MKRYRFYNIDVSGNNKSGLKVSLNIEAVGDFYAGDIEIEVLITILIKHLKLGQKLL